jgi:GT2 family glycosyltransferase
MGAGLARGEYLLILDDDSRVPNRDVINNLKTVLDEDKSIGMAGASIVVPADSNWFQKKATQEFPRFNMKIVDRTTESDMACHGCCIIPKKVFVEMGGEREDIKRGLDPDLRYRLRQAGYKVVLAPNCWVHHPLPPTFVRFCLTFFRNGMGSAYCLKYRPETITETDESMDLKDFKAKRSLLFRVMRFPLRLIKALLTLKFLRFSAYIIYGIGYIYGLLKYTLSKDEKL